MLKRFLPFFIFLTQCSVWGQTDTVLDSAVLWKRIVNLENRILADFPDTFQKAKGLHAQAMTSDCHRCKGRSLMMLGKFYWANGEYEAGLNSFRQSVSIAQTLKDFDTWSKATDLIANTFYYQAYYDSAEFYFQKAYEIADEIGDVDGMINILHNTSLMYHRKGDFKKTVEYIFKGEKLKDTKPQSQHSIEAMGAMGSLMIDSIYYKEEIADELKDLSKYLKTKDTVSIYNTYRNLGKAYRQLEDYRTAARYFVKACVEMEKMSLIPEWDLVATDYRDANMKDSCFYYHYLAKRDFYRTTRPNAAYTIELLGDAHKYFKQFDSAQYYYDSALIMNYRMNNRITFTGIHRSLVRVHTMLGEYDKAEAHLSTGLKLAREIALIHQRNLINEGKLLYETAGNYKMALFYSERSKFLQDSINRQETAINLTRMQAEFKTSKKESELLKMQQLNLLNEGKIKARNQQIGFSVMSLVLIGSFGGLYYSRFKQKKKASENLERQNKIIEEQYRVLQKQNEEKEALLHEIHHRVKNNLQIISSLINLKSRTVTGDTKDILSGLNNRIHSLGLIHEMLYKSDNLGFVDLKEYLTEQSHLTLSSLEVAPGDIKLLMHVEEAQGNIDLALTLGLISNELITNAVKYAFAATQELKSIGISLRREIDRMVFSVTDNGSQNTGFKFEKNKSFGLRFVEQLVRSKLNGDLNVKIEGGLRIEIFFEAS